MCLYKQGVCLCRHNWPLWLYCDPGRPPGGLLVQSNNLPLQENYLLIQANNLPVKAGPTLGNSTVIQSPRLSVCTTKPPACLCKQTVTGATQVLHRSPPRICAYVQNLFVQANALPVLAKTFLVKQTTCLCRQWHTADPARVISPPAVV